MKTINDVLDALERFPKEKWIQGRLLTKEGQYCPLGWLLHEAGVADNVLLRHRTGINIGPESLPLSREQCREIEAKNDYPVVSSADWALHIVKNYLRSPS